MKTILITGANSGIGFECAKQLSKKHKVIAVSRNIDQLSLLESLNLYSIKCDLTNATELVTVFKSIVSDNPEIDVLINNAGIAYYGDFNQIGQENNSKQIQTNITAFTNVIEQILPTMQLNLSGTIINISSLSDRHPRPNNAVYAATKAYVKSLSESLRAANGQYNIRITNIAPAMIDTPMLKQLKKQTDELIAVDELVKIINFIIDQPQHVCIRDIVIAPTKYPN